MTCPLFALLVCGVQGVFAEKGARFRGKWGLAPSPPPPLSPGGRWGFTEIPGGGFFQERGGEGGAGVPILFSLAWGFFRLLLNHYNRRQGFSRRARKFQTSKVSKLFFDHFRAALIFRPGGLCSDPKDHPFFISESGRQRTPKGPPTEDPSKSGLRVSVCSFLPFAP